MNIFDILILGLLILGALQGYRKGLISGLVNLLGSIFGFYFAVKEYLMVFEWLEQHTPLRQWLEPVVYRFLLPSVQAQAQTTQLQTLDKILSVFPKELRGLISSGAVPDFQAYTQNLVQTMTKTVSGVLTDNLIKIIAFFLTYTVVILILQIVVNLILAPIGFFSGTVNRGGGFLFGSLGALVGVAIIMGLITPFLPLLGQSEFALLIKEAWFYPHLLQLFEALKTMFHLEFNQGLQGLNLPVDFTKGSGITP